MNIQLLFQATSFILLIFAAGLISHGVNEFQEAGFFPVFRFDPILNISHILDHNSYLGSMLRTLFGYTSKPTMLEIISYEIYVVSLLWFLRFINIHLSKRISSENL